MPDSDKLLAWIEPRSDHEFLAEVDGGPTGTMRAPAMHICASLDEALQWIADQAAAFGIPVEWVAPPLRPRRDVMVVRDEAGHRTGFTMLPGGTPASLWAYGYSAASVSRSGPAGPHSMWRSWLRAWRPLRLSASA